MRRPFLPTTLALALLGCDTALGIELLPRGRSDAGPAAVVYADQACATCVKASCDAAIERCRSDAACERLYRCTSGCAAGDARCRASCEDVDPATAHGEPFLDVDSCQRVDCASPCYRGGLLRMWNDACGCADDVCAAENLACVRSGFDRAGETIGACERRWACTRDLQNPDRAHECFFTSREGDAELTALRYCAQRAVCGTCPMAGGNVLACVGDYAWSVPRDPIVEYGFITRSYDSALPIPDLTVKACSPLDVVECKTPADTAKTGGDGLVLLHVPTHASGFVGCFEITGRDIDPTLVCNGYPLVRTENIRGVNLLTSDQAVLLQASLGIVPDATRGHVVVSVFDCVWTQVIGATVTASTADASSKTAYIRDRKLDSTALDTGIDGAGALLNLPAGPVTVIVQKDGRIIAQTETVVRAGAITNVALPPRPLSR
jgi:hypothetical protein